MAAAFVLLKSVKYWIGRSKRNDINNNAKGLSTTVNTCHCHKHKICEYKIIRFSLKKKKLKLKMKHLKYFEHDHYFISLFFHFKIRKTLDNYSLCKFILVF